MYIKIVFLALFLFSIYTESQVQQEWVKRYSSGFTNEDRPAAMKVTGNGDIYITGFNYANGNRNLCLIKYNTEGQELWVRTLDGGLNFADEGRDLDLDAEGNIYVAGYTTGIPWDNNMHIDPLPDNIAYTYFLIAKYDPNGNLLWSQFYNRTASLYCIANKIKVDNSGNIYVAGFSDGGGTGYDLTLIKLNTSGVMQWETFYNGTGSSSDSLTSLHVDNNGYIYIAGNSINFAVNSDFKLLKYSAAGAQIWQQSYDYGSNDYIVSSASDETGNIFLTGYSWGGSGINNPNYDWATVMYDNSGNQVWLHRYGGLGRNDLPADIVLNYNPDSKSNFVYVCGYSDRGPQYNNIAGRTVIKYDYSGNVTWIIMPVTGTFLISPVKIACDNSGDIYFSNRYLEPPPYVNNDYVTMSYNSIAAHKWTRRFGNDDYDLFLLTEDIPVSIGLDNNKNVYVTGFSQSNNNAVGNFDIVTIKYSQPDGDILFDKDVNELQSFALKQNYPNPFNPSTNFSFTIPVASNVKLSVFNSLGQYISSVIDKELEKGSYTINWKSGELPSGIYFYKLEAGNFIQIKKMIIVK